MTFGKEIKSASQTFVVNNCLRVGKELKNLLPRLFQAGLEGNPGIMLRFQFSLTLWVENARLKICVSSQCFSPEKNIQLNIEKK